MTANRFTISCLLLLTAACSSSLKEYRKAEDALDAGREYIHACLEGDFSKAVFYTTGDTAAKASLKTTEELYRQKDKEGRQQYRNASININEIKELNDSTATIQYSNSVDKETHILRVVKKSGDWKVDLSKY